MTHFVEGEIDKLLIKDFFDQQDTGVMVEVGAAGPEFLSIGKTFRDRDWFVLSVEPQPHFVEAHLRYGNTVFEGCAGDRDEDDVPFYRKTDNGPYYGHEQTGESGSSLGFRGDFGTEADQSHPKIERLTVKVRKLDTILPAYGIEHIDLLTVDVEGWELQVMAGLTMNPRVVVLENMMGEQSYIDEMVARGYRKHGNNLHNDIFVLE